MGSAVSTHKSIDHSPDSLADTFRQAVNWYTGDDHRGNSMASSSVNIKNVAAKTDDEILKYIQQLQLSLNKGSNDRNENDKLDEISLPLSTSSTCDIGSNFHRNSATSHDVSIDKIAACEKFEDSKYVKHWLDENEANTLFEQLKIEGEKHRPKEVIAKVNKKYPVWSLYYGFKREIDQGRALDRWGSYHESWIRVYEPIDLLAKVCEKLRESFQLSNEEVNSIVVNYYYDGLSTYIPAHKDTTHCLVDNSSIYCLSLGHARDFVLCSLDDSGKYVKEEMTIAKEFRVSNGDMFVLGTEITNNNYCHAVTQEIGVECMRISIIFRSVNRSFVRIDNDDIEAKQAHYASGRTKEYKAECITSMNYNDAGTKTHIADLITQRELSKKRVNNTIVKKIDEEINSQYYLGEGSNVKVSLITA